MDGQVTTVIDKGIATITFTHPAHNSMPGEQLRRLSTAIESAGSDENVRIVVLQSGGERTFCAGASFDELAAIDDFASGKKFFLGFANVINACRKCPRLIIGRVQGKAVGGGVGIAAAVDYCMAAKFASVKLSELALGIGPFVVGPAVQRKTGLSAFSAMAINATAWYPADWALRAGLYTEVFENIGLLDQRIEEFSAQLATMSPGAMLELKRVFWAGTEHWDELLEARAEISGRLVLSDFTKRAIASIKSGS